MYFTQVEIENYKSFHKSEPIKFARGFNVFVGQNGAGKSALLDALSLRFPDAPHRSSLTLPSTTTAQQPRSTVRATFRAMWPEIEDLLARVPNRVGLTVPDTVKPDASIEFYRTKGEVEVRAPFIGGSGMDPGAEVLMPGTLKHWGFDLLDGKRVYANSMQPHATPIALLLSGQMRESVFGFRAMRNVADANRFDKATNLASDGSNLPQVLATLQLADRDSFLAFEAAVKRVLPFIGKITISPVDQSVQVALSNAHEQKARTDLTVRLSETGTGVGQILALLYVVLTSKTPRAIVIDEPSSFLHPGAVKVLFSIFEEHAHHQYIVATHSTEVVAACGPHAGVHVLKHQLSTSATSFPPATHAASMAVLEAVGARLSDVFGAERVLWVEGPTEKNCFAEIIAARKELQSPGTTVAGVQHTGDFIKRRVEDTVWRYKELSTAGALIPPAVGFVFDTEGLTAEKQTELKKLSDGKIWFLPRRMYENYLIVPAAIAAVLDCPVSGVDGWLAAHGTEKKYLADGPNSVTARHGAELLNDLFWELSKQTIAYDKIKHGLALTKAILETAPKELDEVVEVLRQALQLPAKAN